MVQPDRTSVRILGPAQERMQALEISEAAWLGRRLPLASPRYIRFEATATFLILFH